MSIDGFSSNPLPEELNAAIREYRGKDARQLASAQEKFAVTKPLYQYTGWDGLAGIIESQSLWFTDYRHLNDPSELSYGVKIAHEVLAAAARHSDPRVFLFLQMIGDLLVPENFVNYLDFFTASFTTQRDDLSQWRAYGDNGKGFALGFAPMMFRVTDQVNLRPDEMSFVGPVLYDRQAIFMRHQAAIDTAASIFLAACEAYPQFMADRTVGLPFMRELANELIASPLVWNCITSKHVGYEHECEIWLLLLGQSSNLSPYRRVRMRGSESVPYVAHAFDTREPGAIHEIVIGPAAAADAEDKVLDLLAAYDLQSVFVTRSGIPYRG